MLKSDHQSNRSLCLSGYCFLSQRADIFIVNEETGLFSEGESDARRLEMQAEDAVKQRAAGNVPFGGLMEIMLIVFFCVLTNVSKNNISLSHSMFIASIVMDI